MSSGIPPTPRYPVGYDTDETLFKVYNTSETITTADSTAWADEIQIEPVGPAEQEQWGENGFANISGEMFYYDTVGKDSNGKINILKRCCRNLGGTQTKFNPAGTWVRGFVVAEHHRQIADTIIAVETFLKDIEDKVSLLEEEPTCVNEGGCPTVQLSVRVIEPPEDACKGVVITYAVEINGTYTKYALDFGDGTNTTLQNGTHTYAPGAKIDPIVTVSNDSCEVVTTIQDRVPDTEPPPTEIVPTPFEIPIPECPDIPPIKVPSCTPCEPTITLPQIIFPCIDVAPFSFPSFFFNIPSLWISFTGNIPSIISVVIPEIPPISFGPPPSIPVDWGKPPKISVVITCEGCPSSSTPSLAPIQFFDINSFDGSFDDLFLDSASPGASSEPLKVETVAVGIPSEIKIIPPADMPKEIRVVGPSIPDKIEVISKPMFISVDASAVPTTIKVDAADIPRSITLDVPENFPRTITVDGSSIPRTIQVVGVPETIELKGNIPSEIIIRAPENLEIPLVYRGAPIPVQFDAKAMGGTEEDLPCFAIVPCKR